MIWCCACHAYRKRISNDTVAAPRDPAIGSRPVESAIGSQAIERDRGRASRNPARSGMRSGRDRETRDRRQDLGCDRTQTLRYAAHAKRATLIPRDIQLAMRNTNLDHKLVVVLIVQTFHAFPFISIHFQHFQPFPSFLLFFVNISMHFHEFPCISTHFHCISMHLHSFPSSMSMHFHA